MASPQLQAWLDQEDARIVSTIRKHGWAVEYIGGSGCACPDPDHDSDGPPFAYTIGLFGLGHPELLILGVPPQTAAGVLNEVGDRVRTGRDLFPGEMITFTCWPHRVVVEELPNPGDIVFGANRHYQRPSAASVPVLQLSYDDPSGLFPWEAGYCAPDMQPRPGTFRA